MIAHRPEAVTFDVNETLFNLESLRPRIEKFGLPPDTLQWWFAVVLRDGFALAAAGDARPFAELATAALIEVLRAARTVVPDGAIDSIVAGLAELDPHPDVEPALTRMAEHAVPAYALTNGGARNVEVLLDRAGIRPLVAGIVSVDDAGHWKPRPEPYVYAASRAGVPADRLALVATHPWDIHGAARAGLVTGWVDRDDRAFPASFSAPDVEGPDLGAVVDRLLSLPER